MSPAVHPEAERLVRERKAPTYRAACSLIAKRRGNKSQQPVTASRELPSNYRLPYADF
jgi:hypothetical protein